MTHADPGSVRIARVAAVLAGTALMLAACARPRVMLPTDPGTSVGGFESLHAEVSRACRGARTLTAELSLSGRVRGARLRGRVLAGFERPAAMRLEGVAPFGAPAFILVARHADGTLLLPRDHEVVPHASPERLLAALTGIALTPDEIAAILTGCVVPDPRPTGARRHANGWTSIDLAGGAVIYLASEDGRWRVRAARVEGWEILYSAWGSVFPLAVRIRSDAPGVDVSADISQLQVNVPIDPSAFSVEVPPGTRVVPIDALGEVAPLEAR